jgi:ABC-type nickel/cobalt efflux system permease component RcnA
MHTASVLALGFVVLTAGELVAPERVYPWLGLGSGLLAFGLGAGLLVRRIGEWGARAEPADAHEHPHASAMPDGRILSRRAMAALSMAGGILPSPTALVVLLASMALGRVAYGLALLAAFSLGLAAALVVVGIVALRARDAVSRRMSSRFARALPVASASVIATMGLVLSVRGLAQI